MAKPSTKGNIVTKATKAEMFAAARALGTEYRGILGQRDQKVVALMRLLGGFVVSGSLAVENNNPKNPEGQRPFNTIFNVFRYGVGDNVAAKDETFDKADAPLRSRVKSVCLAVNVRPQFLTTCDKIDAAINLADEEESARKSAIECYYEASKKQRDLGKDADIDDDTINAAVAPAKNTNDRVSDANTALLSMVNSLDRNFFKEKAVYSVTPDLKVKLQKIRAEIDALIPDHARKGKKGGAIPQSQRAAFAAWLATQQNGEPAAPEPKAEPKAENVVPIKPKNGKKGSTGK